MWKQIFLTLGIALFILAITLGGADAGTIDDLLERIREADAALAGYVEGASRLEYIMSLEWLVDLGDAYGKLCADIGGDWAPEVPECKHNLFE